MLIKELVKKGVLSEDQGASLVYEVKSSHKAEEELLIARGIISEKELFLLKSKLLKIPLKNVYPGDIDLDLLKLIPKKSAEYYKMAPLGKIGDALMVGMVYPDDVKTQDAIEFLSRQGNFSYDIFLITPTTFKAIFKKYRGLEKEVTSALEKMELEKEQDEVGKTSKVGGEDLERLTETTPISKVISVLMRHALEGGASDVHIEPFGGKLRVRFRVLGRLHSSIFLPLSYLPALVARVKILAELRIDELRIPQDGRFSKEIDGKSIDFRVATFPTGSGEKVAIRVLDPAKGLRSLADLGLPERDYKKVKEAIDQPSGMVLITGPTSSGKTTTLYALLQYLNKEPVNIVTLEDPIEYFVQGINQSQIRPEINYTFAKGLRHVLRQDPDIIMVGEIRDKKSATLAAHASLVGDLLLSTLHTSSALKVVPRLINLGIDNYLIPVTVNIMVSQRLVGKLCDDCKKKIKPEVKIKKLIQYELKDLPKDVKTEVNLSDFHIWKSIGCKKCENKGYSDRIGVFEVLNMTSSLSEVIVEKEFKESDIEKEAQKQGMVRMRENAFLKVLDGITTVEEALTVARER